MSENILEDIRMITEDYNDKYLLLKEINFYEDIDQETSSMYAIEPKNSKLRFICNGISTNYLNDKDFLPVMGNVRAQGKGVEFFPMGFKVNGQVLQNVSRAIYIKPFVPSIESTVMFSFTYRGNCTTSLILLSQKGYELATENPKEKTEDEYTEIFKTEGNLIFSISKNMVYAYTYSNGKQQIIFNSYVKLQETNLCAVLDAKEGKFDLIELGKFNKSILHVNSSDMVIDGRKYCYIGWYDKYNGRSESQWNCHNILYGNKSGYIFLKPIHIYANKIKLLIAYQGKIKLEYWSSNDLAWKEILNNEELLVEDKILNFRIYMNYGDALSKFNIYKIE